VTAWGIDVRVRYLMAALATAVLLATGIAIVMRHGSHAPAARPPVAALAAVPTTAARPTAAPKPALPHDAVAAAAPVAFEIKGPAFTVHADVCPMPFVRPLDPPGDQRHTVCWVDHDFGVAPASTAKGTTYVLGHSWAEAPLVLNPMSIFAMNHVNRQHPRLEAGVNTYPITALDGYKITLRTGTGMLVYKIRRAFSVAKDQAGNLPSLMDVHVPGRVVLITCGVHNGADVEENVIAYAYLISSAALRT
jgi:hypothetical protein